MFRLGGVLAILYASLGDEGICHVINEIEATHILTSSDLLQKLATLMSSDKLPTLTTIIYIDVAIDEAKRETKESLAVKFGADAKAKLLPFHELEMMGKNGPQNLVGITPTADDIALIMYTSGSTAKPKGVIALHKNFIAAIQSLNTVFTDIEDVMVNGNTYIGYLPLAHTMELTTEHLLLSMGVPVGYSSPLTLTDKSPQMAAGCAGDIRVLKPGALVSVPLMMDRLRKGIDEEVGLRSNFKQAVFKYAIEHKKKLNKHGFGTPLVNWLVFKQIKAKLGGNVKFIFCRPTRMPLPRRVSTFG